MGLALPIAGRRTGLALPIAGRRTGPALPIAGRVMGLALPIAGRRTGLAFPIAGRVMGLALPIAIATLGMGLAVAGCGNRQRENHEPPRAAKRVARVIEPSTDRVGPLPPYAIKAEGVGPYKLGERLSDLLEKLPSGPQIVLFEIPGGAHRNVTRT